MDIRRSVVFVFANIFLTRAQSPDFVLAKSPTTIVIEESFTLNCSYVGKGSSPKAVEFRLNEQRLSLLEITNGSCQLTFSHYTEYKYTCDISHNRFYVNIPSLHVENLHDSNWTCANPFGEVPSKAVRIYVNIPIQWVILMSNDTSDVIVRENSPSELICKTSPIRPGGTIQWYLNSTNITSSAVTLPVLSMGNKFMSASVLNYTFTRADARISVFCTGTNLNGYREVKSFVKHIDVEYGPSNITLSPTYLSYVVKENESLGPISCTSYCNPVCSYTWIGPHLSIQTHILRIHNTTRTYAGQIACVANNSLNSYRKWITILVQYPANVKYLNISTNEQSVVETSNVTLSCTAEGEPTPNISWSRNNWSGTTILKEVNNTSYAQIEIVGSKCEDTGTYECSAGNILLFPLDKKSKILNVTCAPKQNISCSSKTTVEVNRYGMEELFVCFSSNPAPEVTWSVMSDKNITLNSYTQSITPILYKNIPNITSVYGQKINLKVTAKNTHGISLPVYYNVTINDVPTQTSYTGADETNRLVIISSAAGVVLAIVIISLIIIAIVKCRHHKSADDLGNNELKSSARSNRAYCTDIKLPIKDLDTESAMRHKKPKGTGQTKTIPIHAEVNKSKPSTSQTEIDVSPVYAMVNKSKKIGTIETGKDISDPKQSTSVDNANNSGLVYVQVSFDENQKGKKFVIREQTERTEYGVIDFTKKADPLPSDDEEDKSENFTY